MKLIYCRVSYVVSPTKPIKPPLCDAFVILRPVLVCLKILALSSELVNIARPERLENFAGYHHHLVAEIQPEKFKSAHKHRNGSRPNAAASSFSARMYSSLQCFAGLSLSSSGIAVFYVFEVFFSRTARGQEARHY
jgi:hypothetical protein